MHAPRLETKLISDCSLTLLSIALPSITYSLTSFRSKSFLEYPVQTFCEGAFRNVLSRYIVTERSKVTGKITNTLI